MSAMKSFCLCVHDFFMVFITLHFKCSRSFWSVPLFAILSSPFSIHTLTYDLIIYSIVECKLFPVYMLGVDSLGSLFIPYISIHYYIFAKHLNSVMFSYMRFSVPPKTLLFFKALQYNLTCLTNIPCFSSTLGLRSGCRNLFKALNISHFNMPHSNESTLFSLPLKFWMHAIHFLH